jgi:hypothetical protein
VKAMGFALADLLVALVLTMVVAGAAMALVGIAQRAAEVVPEYVDQQQRARVATEALTRDLGAAGAGLDGGIARGPLVRFLPPVLPRRIGLLAPDSPTVARADAISVIFVPATLAQSTAAGVLSAGARLTLVAAPNCPVTSALCGLTSGTSALLFDRQGAFDAYAVTDAAGSVVRLGVGQSYAYPAGVPVSQVELVTYYLDPVAHQLRQYDGYQTDVPIVDNVVGFGVEYFGDPNPPAWPKPPPGIANCLYDATGARLPMPVLTAGAAGLAPLPLAMLADGPWCGATGSTTFDADLLRVRSIRVTLRVQAVSAGVRGQGPAFVQPGVARGAWRLVPDETVTFVISPRNLRVTP